MKHPLIPSLVLAAFGVGALHLPVAAAEPARAVVAHGIALLPLDFYLDHRDALDLSKDQVREIQGIVQGMREPGERMEAEMRERTQALHEAIQQNPVDQERVMQSFEKVLQAENQMKMLQFRTRLAMRSQLTAEQYSKAAALAKEGGVARGGRNAGELNASLQQVRDEIRKRSGGDLPREVVEKLERIEQAAKQGRVDEAREQLTGMLRHLREESGVRASAQGQRPGGAERPAGEIEQRMRMIAEKMEKTTDPAQREQLQQQMRKLRENGQHARVGAGRDRSDSAPQGGGGDLKMRIQQIAEKAEHAKNPEVRERLQGAVRGLREAAESGDREAVEKIMRAIEPVLRESNQPRE